MTSAPWRSWPREIFVQVRIQRAGDVSAEVQTESDLGLTEFKAAINDPGQRLRKPAAQRCDVDQRLIVHLGLHELNDPV